MRTRFQVEDSAGDTVLAPVGVFSGAGITLRKVNGMVYARGSVARASGSSTSYAKCVDSIPVGYLPAADLPLTGGAIFNTAVTYQFQATAAGEVQVRMSGASPNAMSTNACWPAA